MIPAILLHVGEVRARAACGLEGLACGRKDLVDLLGRLGSLDGGFCRAYHPKTGIAGYTLISSSRGCRLKSHRAFTTVAEALTRNVDIESETNRFDQADRRRMVSDTDTGAKIRSQIQDLRQLLDAYRNGAIEERA